MEASFVCSYWMHMVAATSPRGKTGGTSPARPRNGTTGYAAMAGTAGACVPHVGCENMPIRCDATNERDVFGIDLPEYKSLERCLRSKCHMTQLWDANFPEVQSQLQRSWALPAALACAAVSVAVALALLLRRLSTQVARYEPLADSSEDEVLLDCE
ncbi:unnamed protein product [Effrenium voratum]|uniref:Uncharacterized protein n=1 Tax=Effrenium voratum TaxID=2562239 RepID=A0AA36N4A4_9DINO|nr:unnamed protein product [Effrenium voratum]